MESQCNTIYNTVPSYMRQAVRVGSQARNNVQRSFMRCSGVEIGIISDTKNRIYPHQSMD